MVLHAPSSPGGGSVFGACWFDLDFTLYDMRQYVVVAFADVAARISAETGLPAAELEAGLHEVHAKKGSLYGRLFNDVLEGFGMESRSLVRIAIDVYHDPPSLRSVGLALYPDAQRLLRTLGGTVVLGIITNGNETMQRRKVACLGLDTLVDYIVYATLLSPKPSPDAFLHAVALTKVPAHNMLYVGDNPHVDFSGAKEAGFVTARVNRGEFKDCPVAPGMAMYQVDSLLELLPLF